MAKALSTSYAATKARTARAGRILGNAEQHLLDRTLRDYPQGDAPFVEDAAVMAAQDIFKAASQRLNAELRAVRKAESIGAYAPYGNRGGRRRF
jgi:hypothetical protein